MSGFNERDYWWEKYTSEKSKLENINSELRLLQERKRLVKNNVTKYHEKYLSFVTNRVIEEVSE